MESGSARQRRDGAARTAWGRGGGWSEGGGNKAELGLGSVLEKILEEQSDELGMKVHLMPRHPRVCLNLEHLTFVIFLLRL